MVFGGKKKQTGFNRGKVNNRASGVSGLVYIGKE